MNKKCVYCDRPLGKGAVRARDYGYDLAHKQCWRKDNPVQAASLPIRNKLHDARRFMRRLNDYLAHVCSVTTHNAKVFVVLWIFTLFRLGGI